MRRPGRVAIARMSSIVAAEAWATSTSIERASIRRTISWPAGVSPPFTTPCAEPPNALSKKWLGDIIRNPASATTSTLAGSPSSAWAPSIASRPAVTGQLGVPRREMRRQIRLRADDREPTGRASGHRIGASGEVERPRQQAPPGRRWPAEGDGQQDDVIGVVRVALDVQMARRLGRGREHLEGHVPLDEPRDVHVAAIAADQQVAPPQQRVGVEVDDGQSLVERPRRLRCGIRRHEGRRVQPPLGPRRDAPARRTASGEGRQSRRGPEGHPAGPGRE